MANRSLEYLGRVLTAKQRLDAEYEWSLRLPKGSEWNDRETVNAWFVSVAEIANWEANRGNFLEVFAGRWQLDRKRGAVSVAAPEVGLDPPHEIPPGDYHIVVEAGALYASKRPVRIDLPPEMEGFRPRSAAEFGRQSPYRAVSESSRRGKSFKIRFRNEYGEWEDTPKPPPRRPPPERPPRRQGSAKDKVDPFIDVAAAMPKLLQDIRRARKNLWIAWWALDTDFPVAFNAVGMPTLLFSNVISAALAANPQLHVYMIIWSLAPWKPLKQPNPAMFAAPANQNRLHIEWQANPNIGSHHQKFLLMDVDDDGGTFPDENAVLWCLGWNGQINYWDVHSHPNPNPLLDPGGRSHQPWHDTGVRVVAEDTIAAFEGEFRRRWGLGGFAPPLPPAPAFKPKPVGNTQTIPKIKIEWARPSPQELFYLGSIGGCGEGIYLENQYFYDQGITSTLIVRYLATELAGQPIHVFLDICHPVVMSPIPTPAESANHIATVRAHTGNVLSLRVAGAVAAVPRPPGGFATVAVSQNVWFAGGYHHVRVTWPGGGAAGKMIRIQGGVTVGTMVTPAVGGAKRFTPIYLHSKLAVIDDSYMIGSCNIGLQSLLKDSETDVVVSDPIETKRLLAILLPNLEGVVGGAANLAAWINLLTARAVNNHDMELGTVAWAPIGLVTEWPYDE